MGYTTCDQSDTRAFGAALAGQLERGDSVLLRGDLGMGKSVLARGIARALGVDAPMPSPTFTLLMPYEGREKVSHFDLYRLSDLDEFEAAGLDEFIGGEYIALIEWPLDGLDAAPSVALTLTRGAEDDTRHIAIEFDGFDRARQQGVRAALADWEEPT